jgi:hypothetical protein
MKKHAVRVLLLLAASLIFVSSVCADVKLDYGADFRLRQEIWDDVVTLDATKTGSGADRNFFRLRTRLWGKVDFSNDFGAYLRLTNEAKWFGLGPFRAFKTNPNNDTLDPDELIVDNLYADVKNLFGAVDLRIGRQDFIGTYGEGFLLMDGTPGDGSRSFYFNAAKANVKVSQNFNFDLTYITDPSTDIYMPSLHPAVRGTLYIDNKKLLTASNEQAFVLYGRGKIQNLVIEPYYIYKIENSFLTGNTAGTFVPKLKLNTIGARAVYSVDSWNIGGEFAHQFGEYSGGVDRRGNGGYVFVGRKYETVTWKPEFDLRFVYLSGDDPNTAKNETWDPLFSRNPYWNELIIYTLVPETGKFGGPIPGYWTNMEILKASVKLNFSPATNLALAYQHLWAPESTSGLAPATMFSNSGTDRGHLPTAILSHKFSKNVDGMLQLEYFIPGNFYASKDNATFFRWQLNVKL